MSQSQEALLNVYSISSWHQVGFPCVLQQVEINLVLFGILCICVILWGVSISKEQKGFLETQMKKVQVEVKLGLPCKFMSNRKQFKGSQFNTTVVLVVLCHLGWFSFARSPRWVWSSPHRRPQGSPVFRVPLDTLSPLTASLQLTQKPYAHITIEYCWLLWELVRISTEESVGFWKKKCWERLNNFWMKHFSALTEHRNGSGTWKLRIFQTETLQKKCEHFLGVVGAGEMCRMLVKAGGKKKGNYLLY